MYKSVILVGLLALGHLEGAQPSSDPATLAINSLGIDLLATASGNTLLSPYSIQAALVMTQAGARGTTLEQMNAVLHLPSRDAVGAFAALEKPLSSWEPSAKASSQDVPPPPVLLLTANRLFGQTGTAFRPAYLNLLKTSLHAPLEELDFVHQPEAATQTINSWVESQTRNRIRNLIPSPLAPTTRLVLVNAIYLQAAWAKIFPVTDTSPQPFHHAEGQTTEVPTMVVTAPFGYSARLGYSLLALPYADHDLQFLIILPDPTEDLGKLEKSLTPALLAEGAILPKKTLSLHLPKFSLTPPLFPLTAALQKLGLTHAFDIPRGSADFDGIAPTPPGQSLFISDIFHKTFLALDENGTEAAAATAVVMDLRSFASLPEHPQEIRVDRPFLFAIQHRPTGACLFLGRMTNPAALPAP